MAISPPVRPAERSCRYQRLRHLAQLGALHLGTVGARRRREGVKGEDADRHLEAGETLAAEPAQRRLVETGARAQRDEGDRPQPLRIGDADDLAAVDGGVALQVRLDLRGRDEITAEPQDVANTALEDEAAIAKPMAEVAAAHPAIGSDGPRRRRGV